MSVFVLQKVAAGAGRVSLSWWATGGLKLVWGGGDAGGSGGANGGKENLWTTSLSLPHHVSREVTRLMKSTSEFVCVRAVGGLGWVWVWRYGKVILPHTKRILYKSMFPHCSRPQPVSYTHLTWNFQQSETASVEMLFCGCCVRRLLPLIVT